MKKMLLALLMLSSFSMMAQQRSNANPLEALQNEKDPAILQEKIKSLENGTSEDLMILFQYYNRDSVKTKAITKLINAKYPKSNEARMTRVMSFLNVKGGPEKTEAHFISVRSEYPNLNLDMEKNLVSLAYAEVPNAGKVMQYINSMEDPVYKVAAINMAIDLINPIDKALALDIATKGFEKAKKLKSRITLSEPMKIDPKVVYNEYINMYSKLLFKAGKNEEAYKFTKEAYTHLGNRDAELTENYGYLSAINGNYEEALPILAKSVKEGKADKKYIDQVKIGYAKLNPGSDVDAYVASLKKEFIKTIRGLVEKSIINETPPDFYIKDINGNKVTLADFKGKTIVLDFWATWCAPCIASFPAMQIAVNKYKNDPDVKFLFIHTAERVPDPLTDAQNLLKKRNFNDFDLYMDTVDPTLKAPPALKAFKISGIPMKYVIDANGKIRFKVSGFHGKDEAVAEEVAIMIEMARKGA
jgi:thiol-disulfide isomerase/thioredoxin